ncbi:hypothetical protein U0070_001035 [Myodes glareolus]|uniref:Uncharacterized protein n=1 Tax=Myodes glareolus TaxID=447135 RepID=A0AAW0IF70_MYOGA
MRGELAGGRRDGFDYRLFLIKSRNSAILAAFKRRKVEEDAEEPRRWPRQLLDHRKGCSIGLHPDFLKVGRLGSAVFKTLPLKNIIFKYIRRVRLLAHLRSAARRGLTAGRSCAPGRWPVVERKPRWPPPCTPRSARHPRTLGLHRGRTFKYN